jgi:dihydroceramidase
MYGSRSGSRGLFSPKYDFMSISICVLGIGSFLYHASLRQNLQFVDDLSMILLGTSMLNGIFTVRQPPARARLISVTLAVAAIAFSAFYVSSGKIIYHVTAFNSQLLFIALRWVYLFRRSESKFPEAKVREWNARHWQAILVCVFGYALWHIDLEFCEELRAIRAKMGLPWAWGLELHGWWHILTAIGADRFMEVVRDIHREDSKGKAEEVQRKEK